MTEDKQDSGTGDAGVHQRGEFADVFSRSVNAGAELVAGFAGALAGGMRAFGDAVATRDTRKLNAENAIVHGIADGLATTLEAMPETIRKAHGALIDTRDEKNS